LAIGAVVLGVLLTDTPLERWVGDISLVDHPNTWCNDNSVECNVGADVVGFLIGAAFVFLLYHFYWKRRAVRHYRARARRKPADLFVAPPDTAHAGMVPSRGKLARGIAKQLRSATVVRPHIVQGDAGAGKSTLLVLLAREVLRMGAIPVAISVRGETADADVDAITRGRFVELIEERVQTAEHATRIYRDLRHEGAIVALADGLDELGVSSPAELDQAVRLVVECAGRQKLACVFACRPEAVPPNVDAAVHELQQVADEDVIQYLAGDEAGGQQAAGAARQALKDLVEAGRLGEVPLLVRALRDLSLADPTYVELLAEHVKRAGPAPGEATVHRTRVALLDRRLADRLSTGLGAAADAAWLPGLEGAACALLGRNALMLEREEFHEEMEKLPAAVRPDDADLVLAAGARLDLLLLLRGTDSLHVRFNQGIDQAHLASRAIERAPEVLDQLLPRASFPALGEATAMSAARRRNAAHTRRLCKALLDAGDQAPPGRRLLLYAAAASTATAGGYDGLNHRLATAIAKHWRGAPRYARQVAVSALRHVDGPESARALLALTNDREDYSVRFDAAQALMERGMEAYDAIEAHADPRQTVSSTLERAASEGVFSEEGLPHRVAVLGWILPTWARTAKSRRPEIDKHIADYADLILGNGAPPGIEASLAQGFKWAARTKGEIGEGEDRALKLLESCSFWYSKVMLLHAVALRTAHHDYSKLDELKDVVGRLAESPHPFVAQAASLTEEVLAAHEKDEDKGKTVADHLIWQDESYAVFGDGSDLDDAAAELVADIVLTLNLTEARGEPDTYRSRTLREAFLREDIPACLREREGRERMLAPARHDGLCCDHGLCPYPAPGFAAGRGELGEAFCHHMATLARKRRRPKLARQRPPWQSGVPKAEVAGFWERMEKRARS
jgi:hypothetical protein